MPNNEITTKEENKPLRYPSLFGDIEKRKKEILEQAPTPGEFGSYGGAEQTRVGEEWALLGEKEKQRGLAQSSIDAINEAFLRTITREERAGEEQMGQTRALVSRAGTLSSSIGQARLQKTGQATRERIGDIEAKRGVQIAELIERADARAEELRQWKAEISLKEKGFALQERQIDFQQMMAEDERMRAIQQDAKDDMKFIAESGVSIQNFKEKNRETYEKTVEATGWDEFVFDQIFEANRPETAQTKYQWYFKGNNLVGVGQDPATGDITTKTYDAGVLGIPADVDPEFITNKETGEVVWVDKNNLEGGTHSLGKIAAPKAEEPEELEEEDYRTDLMADKAEGMPYESAISTYGARVSLDYIDRIYGEGKYAEEEPKELTEKQKYEEGYYKELNEWKRKATENPDQYEIREDGIYMIRPKSERSLWKADKWKLVFVFKK